MKNHHSGFVGFVNSNPPLEVDSCVRVSTMDLDHASFSSVMRHLGCGKRYQLHRLGIIARPNWAAVAGTGLHLATQLFDEEHPTASSLGALDPDRMPVADMFEASFNASMVEAETPEWPQASWRTIGRSRYGYDHYMETGPIWLKSWIAWRQIIEWDIASFDGVLAVEMQIEPTLTTIPVRMQIDRVFQTPWGLIPVDLKSGNHPEWPGQLWFYSRGLAVATGKQPHYAAFWSARNIGSNTYQLPKDLSIVDRMVESFASKVDKDDFIARPSDDCRMCGVRDYCAIMKGSKAQGIDPDWDVLHGPH